MVEAVEQKDQTLEINGVTLTNLDISKIAMICDYLVLDRFNDISSFLRFEKCFGPLLNKEDPNFLIEAFKEICGPKKKYISFGRLISAYIKWKANASKNENFNKFMNIVFNNMIKKQDEVIGKLEEGTRIFSTRNTRGRKVISKFSVFSDSSKNTIQGFNIQYDDFFDSVLCTKKKEGEDKNINLEINFLPNGKTILDRDGISHIAGKFSVTNNIIKFLIFKCRSGKTFYIGDNTEMPEERIELFIFGTSSCQLKTLRIETINDKLAYLEPKFQPSMRVNQKIIAFDLIDEKYINENILNSQLIYEENELQNVPEEEIDLKTLLIPCISDDAFMEKDSLEEKICGKDFNEVYKNFLLREKESEEKPEENKELEKNLLEKTVQRVSLLKFYSKKFKNKENLMVLKTQNANKEEDDRVNMDKYLAKIKFFRKKVDKKKENLENNKQENPEDELEQEEDWVDSEKKEEKVEEPKEEKLEEPKEEKVEEPKEEKVEEPKEEKVEEPKEEKVEEPKEEKVEEPREEKVEEPKEEKVEEPKEEKVEEPKEEKVEEPKEEKVEEPKEEKVEEPKNEKLEEPKEEKVEENKNEIKVDIPKIEEENNKEENKNEIKVDIPKIEEENNKEENKINIINPEDENKNDLNEIKFEEKLEENGPKEEKIRLRGKQPKRLIRKNKNEKDETKINNLDDNQENKKEDKNEIIIEDKKEEDKKEEDKKEEDKKEEDKKEVKTDNKNEDKKVTLEEKKETLEEKIKDKPDNKEDKKEENNNLENYESNKLIDDTNEKKDNKIDNAEEVNTKKSFCATCLLI